MCRSEPHCTPPAPETAVLPAASVPDMEAYREALLSLYPDAVIFEEAIADPGADGTAAEQIARFQAMHGDGADEALNQGFLYGAFPGGQAASPIVATGPVYQSAGGLTVLERGAACIWLYHPQKNQNLEFHAYFTAGDTTPQVRVEATELSALPTEE